MTTEYRIIEHRDDPENRMYIPRLVGTFCLVVYRGTRPRWEHNLASLDPACLAEAISAFWVQDESVSQTPDVFAV